jgi:hypothetical protein
MADDVLRLDPRRRTGEEHPEILHQLPAVPSIEVAEASSTMTKRVFAWAQAESEQKAAHPPG